MVNFVLGAVATLARCRRTRRNSGPRDLLLRKAVEAYYKSVNASEAAALDWDYGRARKRDDVTEGASPEWDYGKRDEVSEAAATPDWDYGRARKRDDVTEGASPEWDYGKRDDVTEGATPEWDYGKRDEVPEAASPDWDYGRVRKRATCNTIAGTQASVADAVSCINYLAGLGSTSCVVSNAKSHFCTIGNAQITGVTSGSIPAASSCNDVARGAGYIMDACTLKDNTVQGSEFAYGNGDLLVWIRKPE
ncbi:hypothetical protein CGCSCA5_v010327 [Colletotrichum siamense]|nr:hypothetical protein CGCSCA5_v010327 [Colletotrichum siamense]